MSHIALRLKLKAQAAKISVTTHQQQYYYVLCNL